MATKKKPIPKSTKLNTKKSAMIQALEKNLGIVTNAAKQIGIDRGTHYLWMEKDPVYRKAVEDIADIALDFAESQLYEQIRDGEVTSTIFYLKTKGKKRGYIEKTETDVNLTNNISTLGLPDYLEKQKDK